MPRRTAPLLRSTLLGLVAALATVVVATLAAAPAGAITNGGPDGSRHPSTGGLVAAQPYSDGTWVYCSGTLISPTVFLTAAHCAESDDPRVRVTFSPAYHSGDITYAGTFAADPLYTQAQSDPHDIAVVVLDAPVSGIDPARLPAAGSLGNLPKDQIFTSVGYGAHAVVKAQSAGGHTFLYDDVRMVATGRLNATTPAWLRLSMNAATGDGGTCYGDSGGPNFLGSTTTVATTTITGDSVCRATNVTYRLDTAAARDFLGGYVALP
ncbi:MAG: trypsin-like serine protease [Lapillicoccus sp.]